MASYVAVTPVYSLLLLLLLPCTLEDSILESCITLSDLLIECMMQSEVYMLPTYVFLFHKLVSVHRPTRDVFVIHDMMFAQTKDIDDGVRGIENVDNSQWWRLACEL